MDESRRNFLKGMVAASFAVPCLLTQGAFGNDFWSMPRTLHLRRQETHEVIKATYFADGQVIDDGYSQICHVLRDVQADQTVEMDLVLLDILTGIQGWFRAYGQEREIIVTSGYRNAHTNGITEGAAKNSFHMKGQASDIHIADVPVDYLANLAMYLQGGGVGIYPNKHIIHVDKGRLRTWIG